MNPTDLALSVGFIYPLAIKSGGLLKIAQRGQVTTKNKSARKDAETQRTRKDFLCVVAVFIATKLHHKETQRTQNFFFVCLCLRGLKNFAKPLRLRVFA